MCQHKVKSNQLVSSFYYYEFCNFIWFSWFVLLNLILVLPLIKKNIYNRKIEKGVRADNRKTSEWSKTAKIWQFSIKYWHYDQKLMKSWVTFLGGVLLFKSLSPHLTMSRINKRISSKWDRVKVNWINKKKIKSSWGLKEPFSSTFQSELCIIFIKFICRSSCGLRWFWKTHLGISNFKRINTESVESQQESMTMLLDEYWEDANLN